MGIIENYRRAAGRRLADWESGTPVAPETSRVRRDGSGRAVTGGLMLVLAAFLWWSPGVLFRSSVSSAHALCSGLAGQFAQVMSTTAAKDCGNVGDAVLLVVLTATTGTGLLAWGAVLIHRAATRHL